MRSHGDYSGLVAVFYDLWFAENPTRDAGVYRQFLKTIPGPALEVGSGTGRLMLPFLREGFDVEGVDFSPAMNRICLEKASKFGLKPTVYTQSMQQLNLKKEYTTIYLPFATFMVVHQLEEAHAALALFFKHLKKGGQLIISLAQPHFNQVDATQKIWALRREAVRPSDGANVLCHESNTYNLLEQVKHGFYRYEIIKNGNIIATHHDSQKFRWYGKHEFSLMLEVAGFSKIEVTDSYTEQEIFHGHSVQLYRAIK